MRGVCAKYEVVVFQPWAVTPPHLGYVAYRYTFKLGLPPHLFVLPFYGSFFSPYFLPPPHPQPLSVKDPLFVTRYQPTLPVQSAAHLDVNRSCHLPAYAAHPCTACLHLLTFTMTVLSLLFRTWPVPKSLSAPWGFTLRRYLRAYVFLTRPP